MTRPLHFVPIDRRRGAAVVGALACAVALVLAYGSGLGVVPADDGGRAAPGGDGPGEPGADQAAPDAPADTPDTRPRTWRPPPDGGDTGDSSGAPDATRQVLPTIVPPLPPPAGSPSTTMPGSTSPPGSAPPTTSPGSTSPPPTSSPGTTTPPTTEPPSGCVDLVGDLLRGLVGHLSGPDVDTALVQQVADVLDLVPQLRSLLGLTADLASPLGLIPDLRSLLGVDVTAVVTVAPGELAELLDAVLRGCPA